MAGCAVRIRYQLTISRTALELGALAQPINFHDYNWSLSKMSILSQGEV